MRVLVIGNGLAGTIFSKSLRELDADVEIDIYGEEPYLYYPRPNLIEYLAGGIPYERLFAFSEDWYAEQGFGLHLQTRVEKIDRSTQEVILRNGHREKYDRLLLANGAYASIPPIQGSEKDGVFTLRTLDDAQNIAAYLENRNRVAVIGGGLLGLEIARALRHRGAEVDVFEFFPRLLPRQLDAEGAAMLTDQIAKMGITVHVSVTTEAVLGQQEATGLKFKGGEEFPTDMVVIAAGVRANIKLADDAGLDVNRGVLVNDFLQTSDSRILAAGDNVEHNGRGYGIIPASFQQSRIAAHNTFGEEQKYEGTVPSNTLKVVGVQVTSIGLVNPEDQRCEEFHREDREAGIYKKIVVQDGILLGAIWMGTKKGVNEINRLVVDRRPIDKWKTRLLDDDFDFSSI